jgi:hypothetical protein
MALSKIKSSSMADTAIHGRRNLIINGAMQVAQRGTSFTGVSNADYTLDRFESGSSGSELVYDVEQSTDAPNGFSNSYKVTVTTEETTLSSGDNMTVKYNFEGQDLQQLKKGTSDAEKVTVSFYVKSSVASTYSLELFDQDNTRVHGQKYTITSADTWEYKTITFDGDTSGSLDNDANKSMRLQFWLDAGSEYTSGTQSTTWQANTGSERVEQSTGFMTTANATWQITGIQLEVGEQATPFEHRSFGEEHILCQRFFQKAGQYSIAPSNGSDSTSFSSFSEPLGNCVQWGGTAAGNCPIYLPVRMRVKPTVVRYGNSSGYLGYIASGGSSPTSDNVLSFHQNLMFTAQTEQMIGINNQVTGSTIWGVFGGWTADAEL